MSGSKCHEENLYSSQELFAMDDSDPLIHRQFSTSMRLSAIQGKIMIRMLKGVNLFPGQSICSRLIELRPGLSQRELANMAHIKPATVTIMLQKMEKSGLIIRAADEVDQRIIRLYITEKGKQANIAAQNMLKDYLDSTLGTLPQDQLELYFTLTNQLLELSTKFYDKINTEDI